MRVRGFVSSEITGGFHSAASSSLSTGRVPTARAYRSMVDHFGVPRPLSMRATAACEVPMRVASSAWVSPALRRLSQGERKLHVGPYALIFRAEFRVSH